MDNQRLTLTLTRRGKRGPWKLKVTATVKRDRTTYTLSGPLINARGFLADAAAHQMDELYSRHNLTEPAS